MASESRTLVILALIANTTIAVIKFVAAAISGSSAMLAEGYHSVADTGNQLFLLRGTAVSRYAADNRHPFGRGKEVFFWSFMVAVFLFVGGAVVAVMQGRDRLLNPEEPRDTVLNLVVLGLAALFEYSIAFRPALKQFNKFRGGRGVMRSVREAKDPALLVVLFEDSAAMVGVAIAAGGVFLADITGNGRWDGAASILVGILLAGT
ncbi:MAG: cation transporter, partial [bacterium]|nr:cation transporter [bacterium]